MTRDWVSRGLAGRGIVGNEFERLGRPRGSVAVTADVTLVAATLGDEVAELEAMLLKKES